MRRTNTSILASIAALSAGAALGVSTAEGSTLPKIPDSAAPASALSPPAIILGSTAGFELAGSTSCKANRPPYSSKCFGKIRWISHTANRAAGAGALWVEEPARAGGTWRPYPVVIKAFKPKNGIFTMLTYTLRSKRPYAGTPRANHEKWGGADVGWVPVSYHP